MVDDQMAPLGAADERPGGRARKEGAVGAVHPGAGGVDQRPRRERLLGLPGAGGEAEASVLPQPCRAARGDAEEEPALGRGRRRVDEQLHREPLREGHPRVGVERRERKGPRIHLRQPRAAGTTGRSAAGVTRRHMLVPLPAAPLPAWSIVGGKLTTCRSLAEQGAAIVLRALARRARPVSRDRPLPGASRS